MARAFMNSAATPQGELIVEEEFPNCVAVFYVPSREKLEQSGLDPATVAEHRVKLLLINGQDGFFTIYPTNTLGGRDGFLKPKYAQIKSITLADNSLWNSAFGFTTPTTADEVMALLEELPSGFIKDYDYGLGLAKDYRFIVHAVEELSDCSEIVISETSQTGIDADNQIFHIATKDFEWARKNCNSITNRARRTAVLVKNAAIFNFFAFRVGKEQRPLSVPEGAIGRLISEGGDTEEDLAEAQQEAVLSIVTKNTRSIAVSKPEQLAKLQSNIELVTLELLIKRYEEMIDKKLKEDRWQAFFNENPFILNMAFGYPVIKVRDQASVGGRKLSGDGEKITDFLVKNSLTNNTAIFEIKTPQTTILNKTPFREGVHTPSADLSGSINQALDQKYQLQKQIAQLKENTRLYDIESYAVHCCLVIGKTPDGDDRKKSFELFRRNSKDVEIVTFDELLEKLKQLSAFLRAAKGGASS
ncbi:MAG: DUF4263 domain-containing protein [Alphaproteobacteria bacterium]|nr:DUF4263 domain-containing protein [Alphaproteobacteria bacterium]